MDGSPLGLVLLEYFSKRRQVGFCVIEGGTNRFVWSLMTLMLMKQLRSSFFDLNWDMTARIYDGVDEEVFNCAPSFPSPHFQIEPNHYAYVILSTLTRPSLPQYLRHANGFAITKPLRVSAHMLSPFGLALTDYGRHV